MPHNVIVSGLPEIKKLKLVFIFKAVLQKVGITKFWMRKIERLPNSSLYQALVELHSSDEAYSAVKILDGYKFLLGNTFPLSAHVVGPHSVPHSSSHRSRRRRMESRNYNMPEPDHRDTRASKRSRSRSPFALEASELDLEIELLKKKTLIIEEERRLLIERKKLELIQAFGPSAARELDDLEESRDQDRRYRSRRSPGPFSGRRQSPRRRPRSPVPRNSRLGPPMHGPRLSRPKPEPSRSKATPMVSSQRPRDRETIPGLPQFVMPCKLILKEMTDIIEKHAIPKEIGHVRNLIRSAIRSRLAVIMDKQALLGVEHIVKLYRASHPLVTDEQFVTKQVKNLRACHLPEMTRSSKSNIKDKTADGNKIIKKSAFNEMKPEEDKIDPVCNTEVNAMNSMQEEQRMPKANLPSAPAWETNDELRNQFIEDDWATATGASVDDWTDWNAIMDLEAMEDQLTSKMPLQ